MRIGFGVDYHQLVEGREFWLGGVLIPFHKGALGHSDADVLLHAICDALLGAAGAGDIGLHFPDTSNEFKGIDSKILLAKTIEIIKSKGYSIGNMDATVCLQAPKIRPHIDGMISVIAQICNIPETDVSIKATTTEKMGFVGRGEGITAYATVLLY